MGLVVYMACARSATGHGGYIYIYRCVLCARVRLLAQDFPVFGRRYIHGGCECWCGIALLSAGERCNILCRYQSPACLKKMRFAAELPVVSRRIVTGCLLERNV